MRTYFLCVYVCNINFDQNTKDKTKEWKNLFYILDIYDLFYVFTYLRYIIASTHTNDYFFYT